MPGYWQVDIDLVILWNIPNPELMDGICLRVNAASCARDNVLI